jgi:hypothetical protein
MRNRVSEQEEKGMGEGREMEAPRGEMEAPRGEMEAPRGEMEDLVHDDLGPVTGIS